MKFLKKQEIENIKYKLRIGLEEQLDKNDWVSLKLHVEEDPSVLAFKPERVDSDDYPFLEKDFFLVYMSDFQVQHLKYCLNGPFKCVCMDSTHGLTHYKHIKMVTLLSIDEFHEDMFN